MNVFAIFARVNLLSRERLTSFSAFFLYFSLIVVGFIFVATDAEYNLNQQISRGYISNNAIFYEPHDPSHVGAKAISITVGSDTNLNSVISEYDGVEIDEDGSINFDLSPSEAEDSEYKLINYYLDSGYTLIETIVSIAGNDYLATIHNGKVRGIYYNGDIVEPPIVEGRFFTEEECLLRDNLAVIGRDFLESVYTRDNDRFVKYNDREYKVIGVASVAGESSLDHLLFINIGSMTPEEQCDGRYYIDGKKTMENKFELIDSEAQRLLGVYLEREDTPITYIDIVSGGMYLKTYLKVLLAMLFVFIYFSILVQIVKRQNLKVAVMALYGISFKTRLMKVTGRIMLSSVFGIVCGIVASIIFILKNYFVLPYELLWSYVAIFTFVSVLSLLLMLAVMAVNMQRIKIGEVIRRV